MTDDFDDDALRHAIGSRTGGPVNTGTARHDVIARAQRTRTLRTGAVLGATSLVVVAGLLVLTGPGDASIEPADQPAAPTVDTDTTIAARPTTTVPATDTATTSPTTSDPATTAATAALPPSEPGATTTSSDTSASRSTEPAPRPTAAPEPTSAPATSPSTTSAPTIAPTTSPTTTTAAPNPSDPPFTRQYNSTGGSITVDWNGSALSLVSTTPNSGFEAEIEDQTADRIRVRFRSDTDESRIEVRAQDGQVAHTVS